MPATWRQSNAWSLMELATLRKQLHFEGAVTAAAEALQDVQILATRSPQSQEIAALLRRAEDVYQSVR
jgi:hypothetical protein